MGSKTTTKGKISLKDGSLASGYIVKVYDWDAGKDDLLGTRTIDSQGNYSVTHDRKQDWGRRRKGRFADVYIEVYSSDGEDFLYRSETYWNTSSSTLIINANVDSYKTTTKGTILLDDGTPAVGFEVRVWDSDVGRDDLLGDASTNSRGEYSVTHRSKQDWGRERDGRFADIYIEVIEKNGIMPLKKSTEYDNVSLPTITINLTIDKIIAIYGAHTIYGKIVYKSPNGSVHPFESLEVIAYDADIGRDQKLGECTTDDEGAFFITNFGEEAYESFLEGKPDIYLIILGDSMINADKVIIWESDKHRRAVLPLNMGTIEIPEIVIKGYIGSYTYKGDVKPVSNLVAFALDYDFIPPAHDELAISALQYEDKTDCYSFKMTIYGSSDNLSGSDIFIELRDEELDETVYTSDVKWGIDEPCTINIGSPDNPLPVEVKEDVSYEYQEPDNGTKAFITNTIVHARTIYTKLLSRNGVPEDDARYQFQFTLVWDDELSFFIPAGEEVRIVASSVGIYDGEDSIRPEHVKETWTIFGNNQTYEEINLIIDK